MFRAHEIYGDSERDKCSTAPSRYTAGSNHSTCIKVNIVSTVVLFTHIIRYCININ